MTSTYDSTGITLDRYTDILDRLITLAEAQWSESVDTSINSNEDSFLGHIIRNIALVVNDINEILQDLYDATSVTNATGARLDTLLSLIGLTRQTAAYSTVTLSITAQAGTTVPAGTQFKTAAGVVFALDAALVFSFSGSQSGAATCTEYGPYTAAIGEVNTIVTPVSGMSAVTNSAAAVAGRNRATDAEQKANHTIAVATSGESDNGSIYEALINLTGTTSVNVQDNPTDTITADLIDPHSMRIVYIGTATNAQIAEAIHLNTVEGVPMIGNTTVSHYDTVTKQSTDIKWYPGAETPVHVDMNITLTPGEYDDDYEDQIRAQLVAHFATFRISQDVVYSALYKPIYTVSGVTVDDLYLGIAASPTGTSTLTATYKQLYTLTAAAAATAVTITAS